MRLLLVFGLLWLVMAAADSSCRTREPTSVQLCTMSNLCRTEGSASRSCNEIEDNQGASLCGKVKDAFETLLQARG